MKEGARSLLAHKSSTSSSRTRTLRASAARMGTGTRTHILPMSTLHGLTFAMMASMRTMVLEMVVC